MTCIFSDGFDSYGATADLVKKWSANTAPGTFTWNSTAGRWGGGALVITNQPGPQNTNLITYQTLNTQKLACGFWCLINQKPSTDSALVGGRNLANGQCAGLFIQGATGRLGFTDQNGTTGIIGGPNICDNQWRWIEYGTTLAGGGTGPCAFYIDGAVGVNMGNTTTAGANGPITQYWIYNPTGCQTVIDDVVIYDDAAGMQYSTLFPVGARRIATTRPSADSGIIQFTPSTAGSHNPLVNEVNPTAANGFVSATTSGLKEIYGYGPLGFAPTSISTVMLNSALENPGGGTINWRGICLSGAVESDGPSTLTPLNLRVMQTGYDVDPNTGVPWTYGNLNSATFGIMVA